MALRSPVDFQIADRQNAEKTLTLSTLLYPILTAPCMG
jgi:hypothetical protein